MEMKLKVVISARKHKPVKFLSDELVFWLSSLKPPIETRRRIQCVAAGGGGAGGYWLKFKLSVGKPIARGVFHLSASLRIFFFGSVCVLQQHVADIQKPSNLSEMHH